MNLRYVTIRTCVITTAVALMLLCSSCDWAKHLPGGYKIVQTMSDYIVISYGPNNRVVIEGNVEKYLVMKNAIVGYAGKAPAIVGPVKTGYFIIGLQGSRSVHQGLSKKQWLVELKHYGITREPDMEKP